jgi:carbon storage regulator CsrA
VLVLGRHVREGFVIVLPDGRTVRVSVLSPRTGEGVRLGVQAPADVRIWRDEVWAKKQAGAVPAAPGPAEDSSGGFGPPAGQG